MWWSCPPPPIDVLGTEVQTVSAPSTLSQGEEYMLVD